MAYNYEEGGRYYLPVVVDEIDEDADYPVNLSFLDGSAGDYARIKNKPGLLLTAEEINDANIIQARDNDKTGYEELKKRYEGVLNDATEMSDEIKVLKSENERLSKQNEELGTKIAELTAWYKEANKTASEAAEANDELKAKITELRDEVASLKAERCALNGQVGKNLAEIQALSSDVHFFKEACKKQKAECDELKGRYDELDSVNKEQAEKIRKLDKRNKYLESEKNRKPIVHVLTNDGHVYAFTSSGKVSVKYHTELNILMIEDGEKTIAGFARGDKPGNLSAWWTE